MFSNRGSSISNAGIYIGSSNGNNITLNTAITNTSSAFSITGSTNNTFTLNTGIGNVSYGFVVSQNSNNSVFK